MTDTHDMMPPANVVWESMSTYTDGSGTYQWDTGMIIRPRHAHNTMWLRMVNPDGVTSHWLCREIKGAAPDDLVFGHGLNDAWLPNDEGHGFHYIMGEDMQLPKWPEYTDFVAFGRGSGLFPTGNGTAYYASRQHTIDPTE